MRINNNNNVDDIKFNGVTVVRIKNVDTEEVWYEKKPKGKVKLQIFIDGDTNNEFEAYGSGEYDYGTVVEYGVRETENRVSTASNSTSESKLTFFDHFSSEVYDTKGTITLTKDTVITGYVYPLTMAVKATVKQTGTYITTNYYKYSQPTTGGAFGIKLAGRKSSASGTPLPAYDLNSYRVLNNTQSTTDAIFYYRTNARFSNTMFVEADITSVKLEGFQDVDIVALPLNSTVNYSTLTGSINGGYRITKNCIIDANGKVVWARSASVDTNEDGITAFGSYAFTHNKTATILVTSDVTFEDTFAPMGYIYELKIYDNLSPEVTEESFNYINEGGSLCIKSGRQTSDWYNNSLWKSELITKRNWTLCTNL